MTTSDNDLARKTMCEQLLSVQPLSADVDNMFNIRKHEDIPEAERLEIELWMKNVTLTRKEIRKRYPISDKFITDTMPCLICETGTVAFMISDHYNGHIHARCNTNGCINWME